MIAKIVNTIFTDFQSVIRMLRTDGFKSTVKQLNSKDAPGTIQFAKYGICGVASVIVLSIVAYIMFKWRFPVNMTKNEGLTLDVARQNYVIAESIAFVCANFTAYFLNVLWVFTPGRHSKIKEFTIFTAISTFSFVVGMIPSLYLMGQAGEKSGIALIAHIMLIVVSALVNFICRKLFVFER